MIDMEFERRAKRSLPLLNVLAAALLVLTLGAILYFGREIFVPIALAFLLTFILAPAANRLGRLGLPKGVAVPLTVLLAFGGIGLLMVVMGTQLAALGSDLPKYQSTIRDKIVSLSASGGPGSSVGRAIEVFSNLSAELAQPGVGGEDGTEPGEPTTGGRLVAPTPVVIQEEHSMLGTLGLVVSPLLHPLATTVLVLVFTVFILAAREDLRNRFIRLVGTEDIQYTTMVMDDAGRRLSRLFLMQLALNAAFGAVIAAALWVIGIPSPVLWGIIAGVFRFVPYVGAVGGALAPLALAFAIDPGWSMLIATALLFAIIEPIVGHVVEPLVFGHSTGVSPVAVILAAAVWTFLWGPIGLVLATPLTVCLVVLGRHVPALGFIGLMLGDSPALSPAQIFYQRMLAGDPSEAVAKAREVLRGRSLATYYDEIALEALRLAHEDVARGRLSPERQDAMRRSTLALVAQLDRIVADPRPKGGQVGSEAAAAVEAVGPDKEASTRVLAPADLLPAWRVATPVVCLARADSLDEVAAMMAVQVLRKHGLSAAFMPLSRDGACDAAPGVEPAEVRMACVSYMEPLSTLHLRHAVRLARRFFGRPSVVVGIWRERDPTNSRNLKGAARADHVAATVGGVLAAAMAEATGAAVKAPRPAPPVRARLAQAAE
jgi:predicted PurR-regulated permease PerM